MPGFPPDPPPSEHLGGAISDTAGSDAARDMELFKDLSEPLLLSTSSPLELNEEETQRLDSSWSQDGDLPGRRQ